MGELDSDKFLIDVRGATIEEGAPMDDPEVYLPHHEELISHVAIDIGGSLAKVVYFTRASRPNTPKQGQQCLGTPQKGSVRAPSPVPNGVLEPRSLKQENIQGESDSESDSESESESESEGEGEGDVKGKGKRDKPAAVPSNAFSAVRLKRNHSASYLPMQGGRLNFCKFETTDLGSCIAFIQSLIISSAVANQVRADTMKKHVKIMATGGGAHKFYDRLRTELGVEVQREEEMECLVLGLAFVMEVPNEVFWYTDELVQKISHTKDVVIDLPSAEDPLPRPSPDPPVYSISFDTEPTPAQFPFLLVNIGSGVSIIKVTDYDKFERISGTSLGGGTLWGLLSLLTQAQSFDEMLALADQGDNSEVDMLVGDIYGQDYNKIGLKSSTIASSFGKVFKRVKESKGGAGEGTAEAEGKNKEEGTENKKEKSPASDATPPQAHDTREQQNTKELFHPPDIAKSLLYAISNNIGQIAYMNAEKHNLDRIYFGGNFIRGHSSTISTLSYAIRFWSKGTKRAHFLRHEGYLGGIGAWLKNLSEAAPEAS